MVRANDISPRGLLPLALLLIKDYTSIQRLID